MKVVGERVNLKKPLLAKYCDQKKFLICDVKDEFYKIGATGKGPWIWVQKEFID